MAAEGIEQVLILPFSHQVARLSPEEFARQVLVAHSRCVPCWWARISASGIYMRATRNGLLGWATSYGFLVEVVPAVELRGRLISSSLVRRLIESGDVPRRAGCWPALTAWKARRGSGRGIGSTQTGPNAEPERTAEVLPARAFTSRVPGTLAAGVAGPR